MIAVFDENGALIGRSVSKAKKVLGWTEGTLRRHSVYDTALGGYRITSRPWRTGYRGGSVGREQRPIGRCLWGGCASRSHPSSAGYCRAHYTRRYRAAKKGVTL